MAQQQVTTPYHHDVQVNGTPIVPSSSDNQLGVVPVANADGTNVGGGTQYTDGNATPANPVGNQLMFNDSGTERAVSNAKPLPVLLASGLAGEDTTANRLLVEERNSYQNITTNTTTTVKSGSGFLKRITVNNIGSNASWTIYDNTAGSGTKIGTPSISAGGMFEFPYDVAFSTGLTIVTTGTTPADITVDFR